MNSEIRITRVTGADLNRFIPEIARLHIQVFRDYPYLYDGDLDYEARYLRTYSQASGSVVVLTLDGDRVTFATDEGRSVVGTLVRYNRKTVSVLTDANVSPHLLRPLEPRDITPTADRLLAKKSVTTPIRGSAHETEKIIRQGVRWTSTCRRQECICRA